MPLPPNLLKATLMFNLGSNGWSESFFWVQTGGDLNNASASLEIIAQKRAPMLGKEGALKAWRVSYETDGAGLPVLGDSKLREAIYPGTQTEPAAEADVGILMRFQGPQGLTHRNMFVRGVWDSVETDGGAYNPAATGWSSKLNSWIAAMLARGVGWVHSVKLPKKLVTGYTVEDVTNRIIITCEAGTFGAGPYTQEVVRFSKINQPGVSQLNGQVLILPLTDTTCVTVKPYGVFPFSNQGFIQRYDKEFLSAGEITAQKLTTRRVGAPLLVSRGRAKVRAKG